MRSRLQRLAPAALALAIPLLIPHAAGSETAPTVEAVNEPAGLYSEERHLWSPPQVTVAAGGTVTFQNPGAVNHGIHWISGPATPTCSSGVPVGTEATASGSKWSGTCTFAQPGTYTYYCTVHPAEMHGTITVNGEGVTTVTGPTPPAGGGSSTPGSPSPEATEPSPGERPYEQLRLAAGQRGGSVRGSLEITRAGVGGRLEVSLLAKRAALGGGGGSATVVVGRLTRTSLKAGALALAVALDARAKRALRAHRRLVLTVELSLRPPRGAAVTVTRRVTLGRSP